MAHGKASQLGPVSPELHRLPRPRPSTTTTPWKRRLRDGRRSAVQCSGLKTSRFLCKMLGLDVFWKHVFIVTPLKNNMTTSNKQVFEHCISINKKMWFSIAMLVYWRVPETLKLAASFPLKIGHPQKGHFIFPTVDLAIVSERFFP